MLKKDANMSLEIYKPVDDSELVLEPPYSDKYKAARLMIRTRGSEKRKYVFMYTKALSVGECNRIPYARYVYQVDLWKRKKELIPEGMQVDHIDDNTENDTLSNLQLLTRMENIRKRDYRLYKQLIVSDELLKLISDLLETGSCRSVVCTTLKISYGYLRYLINEFLPKYSTPEYIERDTHDIISRIKRGESQYTIADDYCVHQSTISRMISKVAPEYSSKMSSLDKAETVKRLMIEGLNNKEIAEILGCTDGNVIYYMKTFLPDLWKNRQEEKDSSLKESIDKVKALLAEGVSRDDIAKEMGYQTRKSLDTFIRKHDLEASRGDKGAEIIRLIALHPYASDAVIAGMLPGIGATAVERYRARKDALDKGIALTFSRKEQEACNQKIKSLHAEGLSPVTIGGIVDRNKQYVSNILCG